MNPKQTMQHIYLFTLEILPLETGKMYNELPSHLTLMSRFATDMSSKGLRALVQPLFDRTSPIVLEFGPTTTLGPKKTRVHMRLVCAKLAL